MFLRGISKVFLNAPEAFNLAEEIARYYEAQLPKSKSRLGFRDLRQVLKAAVGLIRGLNLHVICGLIFLSWFFEENGPKVTRSGFVFFCVCVCVFCVKACQPANDKNCWGLGWWFGFGFVS